MASQIRRIGILTGGGDCPGLNAVIRAVAKAAMGGGLEVVGIEDGYLGLIENRMRSLHYDDVSGILTQGGTILGSCNKANPEKYAVPADGGWVIKDVRDQVAANYHRAGLDAMVVIGGDGTMSGAAKLIDRGLRTVGVPKTIDNDLWGTEITFGHQTAVNTAAEALDKVHTTASSHHRVMVVELMGRYAGWIALNAGVAAGADVILIPEIPFSMEFVASKCLARSRVGKGFTIIAVGEGAAEKGGEMIVDSIVEDSPDPIRLGGIGKYVADRIQRMTGLDSRAIVLGHIQRGGSPTPVDRLLATKFGYYAYELLRQERFGEVVVQQHGQITSVPIADAAGKIRTVPLDDPAIAAARAIGTCFGDEECHLIGPKDEHRATSDSTRKTDKQHVS
jgi:6-phosphofructokinase 1